jgi:hypothetical protein
MPAPRLTPAQRQSIARGRRTLVRNLNTAFSANRIAATARQLANLPPQADFLDITKALGFLDAFDRGNFAQYRRSLPFPYLIQAILTLIYRTALFSRPRTPMKIQIQDGRKYSVEVSIADRLISVVLTRPLYKK